MTDKASGLQPLPYYLRQTWVWIARYIHCNGYPPTVREVQDGLYWSFSTTRQRMKKLEALGYITREKNDKKKARAWQLFIWPPVEEVIVE